MILIAVLVAGVSAWTCDDAFISFRYAEHLLAGEGLVFNPGERVEGMTNLAWTVWVAAGMKVSVGPQTWTNVWGIGAYAVALVLLARWDDQQHARSSWPLHPVPIAVLLAVALPDWQVYATSGLETSAFTSAVLAGYVLIAWGFWDPAGLRGGWAGAAMALAAVLRPEGLAFALGGAVFCGLLGAADGRARRQATLRYLAVFALSWGSVTAWRVGYYGDFFPNTYYAKSGGVAWWSQGAHYVQLFVTRYWALVPFVVAAPVLAWRRGRSLRDPGVATALSAAVLVAGHTLYVARVGGDFMFARFLVPVLPLMVICAAWTLACIRDPGRRVAAAVGVAGAAALTPSPVAEGPQHGISDEHAYWGDPEVVERFEGAGRGMRTAVEGLPMVVAHMGAHARIIYRSKVAVAVDAEGGLTDPVVARQSLSSRGRPGHEKRADYDYLRERGVHMVAGPNADAVLGLRAHVPAIPIDLHGATAWVIRWDPELMASLKARGVVFPDFVAELDGLVANLDRLPDEEVRRLWGQLRRFYFDHVTDPRAAAFEARLSR